MFGNAQKSKIVQSLILASAGVVMVFVFDSIASTPPPHPHIFLCVPLCSSLAGSVRPQDSLALPHWELVQSERVSASCDASASLVNNYTHITLPLPSLAAWKDAGFIPSRGKFSDKLSACSSKGLSPETGPALIRQHIRPLHFLPDFKGTLWCYPRPVKSLYACFGTFSHAATVRAHLWLCQWPL